MPNSELSPLLPLPVGSGGSMSETVPAPLLMAANC
jgi:hypothetical protein